MIENQINHAPDNKRVGAESARDLLHEPGATNDVVFESKEAWRRTRPSTLVVACSDGRLQKSIDEFLERQLGVVDYDRLYAPGGPGLLGTGTSEVKTDQFRREMRFLVEAHRISEIVLLFHGAARSGPEDAMCAHYKRTLPGASRMQVARQQRDDAAEAMAVIASLDSGMIVHVYRAEAESNGAVHFVNLRRR